MAPARLIAIGLALALAAPARADGAAPPPCTGRFVVARSTGRLVAAAADVVVLGASEMVLDPACGAAAVRARSARRSWRLAASWPGCRSRPRLRLRARTSRDCSTIRGTVTAHGAAASRFLAVQSRCGDGLVDPGAGERCDDGNLDDRDGCDTACGRCVDPSTLASTWAAVQANVFDRSCTGCHGVQRTAGLDLRGPGSYDRIVGVPTPDGSGRSLIAPGARSASLVWLKIAKGTYGGFDDVQGGGMPFGYPLASPLVEALGRWIDAGAPRAGTVVGAEALFLPCAADVAPMRR